MKKILILIVFVAFLGGFFLFNPLLEATIQARAFVVQTPLCGEGSASEDYGFTYELMQPHWTVDGEQYVTERTLNQVDILLDNLEADNIAQTMILFLPEEKVGDRVNCAVHFLRYMQLGNPDGNRKDNGFVFLFVIEKDKIDVHYGVGLGLPALTAHDLTNLNRLAEKTFQDTDSMDEALLALVDGFDEYARSQYLPWYPEKESAPSSTIELTRTGVIVLICVICIGVMILMFILFLVSRLGGRRRSSGGGPVIVRRAPSWSRPSSSPRSGAPRMRGGSGSGRSHRGN